MVNLIKNYYPKKLPNISIIIPTLLADNTLKKCIQSAVKLNYPKNKITLIIVDNGSKKKFSKIFKKIFPGIKILKNKINLGFAKAVNQAINKFPRDYFFITNDDIVFEKKSLLKLVNFAKTRDEVGICGGQQLNIKTHNFLAGGKNFSFLTGRQTTLENAKEPTLCDQIDGCTMLIKKEVIKSTGLFDEGYFPAYSEDLDLCIRTKRNGFEIFYIPDAIFYHHLAHTTSTFTLNDIYYFGFKNRLRFFIKHANIFQFTSFIIFHYLLTMPIRIVFRGEPIFIPEINAILWNFKNLKKTLTAKV